MRILRLKKTHLIRLTFINNKIVVTLHFINKNDFVSFDLKLHKGDSNFFVFRKLFCRLHKLGLLV